MVAGAAIALAAVLLAGTPPPIAPAAEARGEVSADAAEALYKRSRSARVRKRQGDALVAASDAYPDNPSYAAAASVARFEAGRWCEALRLALRAWRFQEGIPRSLRSYVLDVKVLPTSARRCAKAGGGVQPYGRVRLEVSPAEAVVQVAGHDLGRSRVVALAPGTHELRASAPGFRPALLQVVVAAGEAATARVVLERTPEPPSADTRAGVVAGAALATLRPPLAIPAPPPPKDGSWAPAALMISGAVLLVGGGVLYGLAHVEADGVFDGIPDASGVDTPEAQAEYTARWKPVFDERVDRARTFELVGWIGLGVGAALVGAGAIAASLDADLAVDPEEGSARLGVRGRF